ncbi:MAG: class I SAM-dependent methyltransferase [Acidimicrobiales bacterium]
MFRRHYDERVPTIERSSSWGCLHRIARERYDLVADAVAIPPRADGFSTSVPAVSLSATGSPISTPSTSLEFGVGNLRPAAAMFAGRHDPLAGRFVGGDGERLPLRDGSVDVLVMSEVIEHLLHPDSSVWEVARVLRHGGTFVMTTNNASEMPCSSPLKNPLAWLEKALGATRPSLISLRPWAWPYPVDTDLVAPGSGDVHLPHTHHIFAETRDLFSAAGLDTFAWSTFEFPPPQSLTDRWLEQRGEPGRLAVDAIEGTCRRIPFINRMGCHLFMQARKVRQPMTPQPPAGLWPGPSA